MKASKYFEMPTAELQAEYNSLKEKLFNLRFQHKAGQLESGKELTKCKKDIARVLTVLRQRELGISADPVKATRKAKTAPGGLGHGRQE